jgi:hypothetical protein
MNLHARLHDRRQRRCTHQQNVSVMTAGIERLVCESCGHVSVRFSGDPTPDADPAQRGPAIEEAPDTAQERVSDIS